MSILNYIIEANAALILVLAFYLLFLRRETNFRFSRLFLLAGIFASVLFPLIDIGYGQSSSPLSISQVIPAYWLPEVVIGGGAGTETQTASLGFWEYTTGIYLAGLILCCSIVLLQLGQLLKMIRNAKTYRLENLRIAESTEDKPIFSFFDFIFIGKSDQLSPSEKAQIIRHESVHARQLHSFDILLVNVLSIFFWFNPFISMYKNIFIQLHEFEADARAVENADVNKYCSLLAKVALQSANFTLANHFNNSLTVKRIEMMRTLKTNIKQWKVIAMGMMLPLMFFFVACQDQVGDEIADITRNSTHALIVPKQVQARFDQLKKANPEKDYVLLELNKAASQKLEKLESQFGLPASVEVFKTVDGKVSLEAAGEKIPLPQDERVTAGQQTFAILEYTEKTNEITEQAASPDKVYTVVPHQPEYSGGYPAMMEFLKQNIRYPLSARQNGKEGRVFVQFIVERDGSISDVTVMRGVSAEIDAEAVRVVQSFPPWTPGKLKSLEPVKVKFVLPIRFEL